MGHLGTDSFKHAITEFRNHSLHAYVNTSMQFRGQIITEDLFQTQSGWNTAMNEQFKLYIVNLDSLRRKITHNPTGIDLQSLIDIAIDTSSNISTETTRTQQTSDIVSSPGPLREIQWKLDGTDPNVPSLSSMNFRNANARTFVGMLDYHITNVTRLDCAHSDDLITANSSLKMYSDLAKLMDVLETFGGDDNRMEIISGVRRTEEPQGINSGATVIGQAVAG